MVGTPHEKPNMSVSEMPTLSEHCWIFLRALREAAKYVAGRMNVARGLRERWTTVLPTSVKSILFLCKGNICRSPLAEAYFQYLVHNRRLSMTVRSAGLDTTPGKPAHANSKAVALQRQLSLDAHVTTQVHAELLDQSDLIIVMEIGQKDRVHRLYPNTKGKVALLGCFDEKGPLEIADPYSGTIDDFHSCFDRITRCCDTLAAKLRLEQGELPIHQISSTTKSKL